MVAQSFFRDLIRAHRRIEQLVTSLEVESDPAVAEPMIHELLALLAPHMAAEDAIIIPALQKRVDNDDDRIMLHESGLDHAEIWDLARRMQEEPAGSDATRAAARALNKFLTPHIEEEENETMPLALRILPYEEFARVAKEVQERQAELIVYVKRRLEASEHVDPGTLYQMLDENASDGE